MSHERIILHSDMNSFYASVETMLDPALQGKAVAVCGSTESRHGIVLAKSQSAKKAGVKTGMANWEARQLCPKLTIVPPQYDQYMKYSRLAHEIYGRYTNLIEPFGMDECWLDVSQSLHGFAAPLDLADQIRRSVKEELGLTVSIGVSFNKVFAKLGSDMKKPDAITEIPEGSFREMIWPLPADEMIYVGRSTIRKLNYYGCHTIGDVAQSDPEMLKRFLGINGLAIWQNANGMDRSRVCDAGYAPPIKTIGHGITCVTDLNTPEEVGRVMLELSQDVGHRLRVHELAAQGVQIMVRGNDLGFQQFQCPLPVRTQLPCEIAVAAFQLFEKRFRWENNVRAVCVRAINLTPKGQPEQINLFFDHERYDRLCLLQNAVEEVRERYGKRALTYGSLLRDLPMPDDGRDIVRMPGLMYQ